MDSVKSLTSFIVGAALLREAVLQIARIMLRVTDTPAVAWCTSCFLDRPSNAACLISGQSRRCVNKLDQHTPQAGRVAAEQHKVKASTKIPKDLIMRLLESLEYNDRQIVT
jgi:hypothetical protein